MSKTNYFPIAHSRRVCKTNIKLLSPGTYVTCMENVISTKLAIVSLERSEALSICSIKTWAEKSSNPTFGLLRAKRVQTISNVSYIFELDKLSIITEVTISPLIGMNIS